VVLPRHQKTFSTVVLCLSEIQYRLLTHWRSSNYDILSASAEDMLGEGDGSDLVTIGDHEELSI
jgi:hypothetical protein